MWLERLAAAPLDALEYRELLRTRSALPEALEIIGSEQWWAELDELDEEFRNLTIDVGQIHSGWTMPSAGGIDDFPQTRSTGPTWLRVGRTLAQPQRVSMKLPLSCALSSYCGRSALSSAPASRSSTHRWEDAVGVTLSERQGAATEATRDSGIEAAKFMKQESDFRYTLHEVPTGILWGVDGASSAQCAELLNDLEKFASGFEQLIAACRFHYVAYADYLDSSPLPSYQSYLDAVHDSSCPTGR